MVNFLRQHPELRNTLIAAIAFFSIVLFFCLYRYLVFYSDSDHGIFSQVFWNGIHGRFFQSSVSATYSVSVTQDGDVPNVFYHRLAQHFTPTLALWLPVYALFPSPMSLMVIKVGLLTAAGLVLYALSRHYLNPRLSAMITISFYGANAVIGPALGEFYDACQIPLLMFGVLLSMEQRRWWLFALLSILTVMVREDAGLVIFGIGTYMILSRRFPRIGIATCAFSFGYMLLVTTVLMPIFTDEVSRRFMIEEFGHFTDDQQASTLDVIWAIATRPWLLVVELISPLRETLQYVLGCWLPLAFVPALSFSAWVISGFPLVFNLLREGDWAIAINIRYTTPVIPGLFYGTILWWSYHESQFKSAVLRRFWILCLSLSLIFTVTSNPHRAWSFLVPDSIDPWIYVSLPQQWHHAANVRSLLTQIPSDASVSATRYLVPHLANRRSLLRFPGLRFRDDDQKTKRVEYAIVDFWNPLTYQSAFESPRNELKTDRREVDRLLRNGRYGVVGFQDAIVLLKQGAASDPEALADWTTFRQTLR